MNTSHALIHQLPLFPLQAVLFPGGVLPLRVFEVRYLDMIGRSHRAGAPFGVVCLREGSEVARAPSPFSPDARETFFEVGTLASIHELERPQPGLMNVRCLGTHRFKLDRAWRMPHGLWVADVHVMRDDLSVALPSDLQWVSQALRRLIHQTDSRLEDSKHLPFEAPYLFDDCGWVANRWSELLALEPESRQRFMALQNPLLRLELVADMLSSNAVQRMA